MAQSKGGKGKKDVRVVITLECTEARGLGKTPSRYTTTKNRRNTTGRLELMKYNPYLRRHTLHKEIK
jgi:large subunit ribosomal protein L33